MNVFVTYEYRIQNQIWNKNENADDKEKNTFNDKILNFWCID